MSGHGRKRRSALLVEAVEASSTPLHVQADLSNHPAKKFLFLPPPNQFWKSRHPGPQEGRIAIVTDVGLGERWTRQRLAKSWHCRHFWSRGARRSRRGCGRSGEDTTTSLPSSKDHLPIGQVPWGLQGAGVDSVLAVGSIETGPSAPLMTAAIRPRYNQSRLYPRGP